MTGSPPQIHMTPHESAMRQRKLQEEEIRAKKLQREKEFKDRQTAFLERKEIEKKYDRDMRALMLDRFEARLEHLPGHGPTKWLWPTAGKYPRTYVPGGDVLLMQESGTTAEGGPGHALGVLSPTGQMGSPSIPTGGPESPA